MELEAKPRKGKLANCFGFTSYNTGWYGTHVGLRVMSFSKVQRGYLSLEFLSQYLSCSLPVWIEEEGKKNRKKSKVEMVENRLSLG